MTNMLLTLAVLLPAAPAPAPKDTKPKGPAPHVVMLSAVSDDQLQFVRTKQEMVQQQVKEQVTEYVQDGQRKVPVARQVTRTIMVPVPVHQLVSVSLDDKGVQVYGADGKKIDSKDVPKLVKKPVAALLSTDGKPVDPLYLRLAREGTLVLVVPKAVLLRQDFSDPDRPKDAGPKPRPIEDPKPLRVKPAPIEKKR